MATDKETGLMQRKVKRIHFVGIGGIATIERLLGAVEHHAYISGFMFNLPPVKPDGLKTPERIWRALPGAVPGFTMVLPWTSLTVIR